MIDNKRISKIKSAPKNSGKNKMKKINLKRNKKAEEKNHYFTNMPCCNLNLEDWEITVDNCASNHIRKLFDYYVDDDTWFIIKY